MSTDQKAHSPVLALDFRGGEQPSLVRRRWDLRAMPDRQPRLPLSRVELELEIRPGGGASGEQGIPSEELTKALEQQAHLHQQLAIAQLEKVQAIQQIRELKANLERLGSTNPQSPIKSAN